VLNVICFVAPVPVAPPVPPHVGILAGKVEFGGSGAALNVTVVSFRTYKVPVMSTKFDFRFTLVIAEIKMPRISLIWCKLLAFRWFHRLLVLLFALILQN
jgi:hypothetical protein